MNIEINLLSDWAEYLQSKIEEAGYTSIPNDSIHNISYRYFNILKRQVLPRPRTVHESRKLLCPPNHINGYTTLKKKLINGDNVTPHLSKTILKTDYEDPLLNDWGIHHFHLGENTVNGFIERTGLLLFALVKDSDVYCIDIKPHGSWSKQELIETLHNEWPESIKDCRLFDIPGLSNKLTNDNIAHFRKTGVQSIIGVNEDAIYSPIGGGYTTNGKSAQSITLADRYQWEIKNLENLIKTNISTYSEAIKELLPPQTNTLKFKLYVENHNIYVIELTSKVKFSTTISPEHKIITQ